MEFQYYAFNCLGLYVVFLRGLHFPAGARASRLFYWPACSIFRLQGLWLFRTMQDGLDKLESYHYDCFPSGHTELTLLACWGQPTSSPKAMPVSNLFGLHSVPHFCYSLSSIPLHG